MNWAAIRLISLQAGVSRAGAQGLVFTPKQLFEAQTIRALAAVAINTGPQALQRIETLPFALVPHAVAVDRSALDDLYPLSPMQQGMLFHCNNRQS